MPEIIDSLRNANLGWQYYKNYYESNNGVLSIENKNRAILLRKFTDSSGFFGVKCKNLFELKINYPGLLTGSGYTHEYTGDDKDGAFKIGFFFDHISGMPYITGHGIKGALRYAFPNHKNERHPAQKALFICDLLREKNINTEESFKAYLSKVGIQDVPYSDLIFATLLGEVVFEGNRPIGYNRDGFVFAQLPLYEKDIFYECFIVNPGKDDLFLADDYITPHIPNPLKNPVPIKFLKILPGVSLRFQFDLRDNLITAKQKEDLFKSLILTLGIGAKTNVGYGQFSETKPPNEKDTKVKETFDGKEKKESTSILDEVTKSTDSVSRKIKNESEWDGEIISSKGDNFLIQFEIDNEPVVLKKKKDKFKNGEPVIGKKVRIKFASDFINDPPAFTALIIT